MMRLDRWLVTLGVGSRSQVQKLIRQGAVQVGEKVITDPGTSCDTTAPLMLHRQPLDGRLVRHVMLHKPSGLLTAARDKKQPTVMELLPQVYSSIGCMPVGRLDKDTTGLLLLTCDGEMNHRLLSPARHVDKTYLARVDTPLSPKDAEAFAQGLQLSDFQAKPARLEILEETLGRLTIHEGKFHQVKRMFAALGHEVLALHRESFGSLVLDETLLPGQWRELTQEEVHRLYADAQMEEP